MLKERREAIKKLYKAYKLLAEVEGIENNAVLFEHRLSANKSIDNSKNSILYLISEIGKVDNVDLESYNENFMRVIIDTDKIEDFIYNRKRREIEDINLSD